MLSPLRPFLEWLEVGLADREMRTRLVTKPGTVATWTALGLQPITST